MADAPSPEPARPRKCPNCGKPRQAKYDPFCSRRCADVDLGRWLKGAYVIAGAERPDSLASPDDGDE